MIFQAKNISFELPPSDVGVRGGSDAEAAGGTGGADEQPAGPALAGRQEGAGRQARRPGGQDDRGAR